MSTTKPKRAKGTAPALDLPQTDEELNSLVAAYGAALNEKNRLQAGLDDAIAQVKALYEGHSAPVNAQLASLFARIQGYAEAHRDRLLPKDRKFAELPAGLIGWRTKPPRVELAKRKGALEAVIETIERLQLTSFLRVKKELNKEAILAHPEAVDMLPGVSIRRDEEQFEVAPVGIDLAPVPGGDA